MSAPTAAQEKSARVYRVGVLDTLSAGANAANLLQFQKGMRELGYVEGRNLTTEYHSAEGRNERFAHLAAKLVRAKVDAIVARTTPAALAAKNAPDMIPIIAAGIPDPVETKLVDSLERPGGKVTGIAFLVKELEEKRIDVLRALAPNRKRIAALLDMSNPGFASTWKLTEDAARAQGMQAELFDVRKPEDIPRAFDAAVARHAEALVVRLGAPADAHRRTIVELAAKHKLPAIYASRQFVDAGGLVSYGVSAPHLYYRAAAYVDKVLKGAKPGELAMEKPAKFELVINRKALHSLGLVLPPDMLLRSDEIV
jgi:putative ABC transport system substrate-binding protein